MRSQRRSSSTRTSSRRACSSGFRPPSAPPRSRSLCSSATRPSMWSATDWSDSGMEGTVRLRRRMIYRPACMAIPSGEQRTAVIDLGSNSFRLVVFTAADGWWKRTDEIYEAVRIGAGLGETGELGEEPMQRALHTIDVFAHFCRALDITD